MPAQNEKPIIFSGPMVRAILEGRKTQTRRVVKPQPLNEYGECSYATLCGPEWYEPTVVGRDGEERPGKPIFGIYSEDGEWGWKCPYEPGMRLWVRETWQQDPGGDHAVCYKATGHDTRCVITSHLWRPSIFMPRAASRLTLEIAEVRVQRLQEISGRDCAAEGCEPDWEEFDSRTCCMEGWEQPEEFIEECEEECDWINFGRRLVHSSEHKEWERDRLNYALRIAYESLWDSINGKSHPWSSNPWVWAVTFKRID